MINLLPQNYIQRNKPNFSQILIVAIVVLLLLAFLTYSLNLYFAIRKVNKKLALVNQKLSRVDKKINHFVKLEEEYKELKNNSRERKKVIGDRIQITKILNDLGVVIPANTRISSFNIKEKKFTLSGYTFNRSELKTIVRNLSDSPYFDQFFVEFAQSKQNYNLNEEQIEVINYKIKGQLAVVGGEKDESK